MRTPAVRPGPGSYRLLCWLARLGVAGIEPMRLALGLSQPVAYKHVARLAKEGLVNRVVAGDGGGGVVIVTHAGARASLEHGAVHIVSARSAAPSSARHGRAVSWVAASAELRGWSWLGPAELREQSGWRLQCDDGARHAPDLGIVHAGTRTAVEVELHPKARQRVRTILRGYRGLVDGGSLTAVSYVVDRRDVEALIRSEADSALLGKRLYVGPLDAIVNRVRSDAARVGEKQ